MPILGDDPSGYASAFISGWGEFIVTHSVDFQARGQWKSGGEYERLRWDIHASYVNSCGGFLFPSLGVGQIPAAMFGLTNLIFDPAVVLSGMKPYAKRGRWPVVTYTTDVWTGTMSKFLGEASETLYQQLTGQWHVGIYRGQHMYILGPPVEEEGGVFGGGVVPNTKKLSTELKRRGKIWQRGLTGEEIEGKEALFVDGPERYPYLEAKANGIISPRALAACTCPEFRASETEQFLQAIGFEGDFLVIPTTPEERLLLNYEYEDQAPTPRREDRLEALYEYSWRVHDAIEGLNRALVVQLR
jgi:hypothetical protein